MKLFISALAGLFASSFSREIVEVRPEEPKKTNMTLAFDVEQFAYITYSYWTTLEVYDDGTSERFLNSHVILHDVNTYYLKNDRSFVRMSIGWKNIQEDAYDVSSVEFLYNSDLS